MNRLAKKKMGKVEVNGFYSKDYRCEKRTDTFVDFDVYNDSMILGCKIALLNFLCTSYDSKEHQLKIKNMQPITGASHRPMIKNLSHPLSNFDNKPNHSLLADLNTVIFFSFVTKYN